MSTPKPLNVLGITGTVQTGKSELRPVFEECGWVFHDLNDPQCDLRAVGTERYEMFNSRFPGCLRDDGAKTGLFYDLVTPEFYHPRIEEDLSLLIPVIHQLCKEASPRPVALSWEYLPRIAKLLPLDHTLLFTSEHGIWLDRLHARLKSRGVSGEVTAKRIRNALDLLDVWPEKIRTEAEREMAGKLSAFDVSAEDWGAQELRAWLKKAR